MEFSWKLFFISFVFLAVVVPKVKADSGSSLDDEVEVVKSDVPSFQELEHLKSKIQSLGLFCFLLSFQFVWPVLALLQV